MGKGVYVLTSSSPNTFSHGSNLLQLEKLGFTDFHIDTRKVILIQYVSIISDCSKVSPAGLCLTGFLVCPVFDISSRSLERITEH